MALLILRGQKEIQRYPHFLHLKGILHLRELMLGSFYFHLGTEGGLHFIQRPFPNRIQFGLENLHTKNA